MQLSPQPSCRELTTALVSVVVMEKAAMTSSSTSPAGEIDQVSVSDVMDIAGLILYDTEATPIRLKVLLDRLLSALSHDQVLRVLAAYGWAYDDFCRGYKLQVTVGAYTMTATAMKTRKIKGVGLLLRNRQIHEIVG